MSWVPENPPQYSVLDWIGLRLLRCGEVPRHVAFIMDGNRRYAKERQLEKIEGHSQGFDKLAQVLQWCNDLGVEEVTVYAFSIENFKRPKAEVDGLLDLAREKFRRLISEKERLREHGIRVRVIGNVSLLPEDLVELIAEAEAATRDNGRRLLNVAFSYTSREEMARAVKLTALGVEKNLLDPEDITEGLLERCLYTGASSKVDLLIRTSGEVRLSDFLLWQSSNSVIYFTGCLWPEFSARNFLAAVFHFQRNCRKSSSNSTSTKLKEDGLLSPKQEQRLEQFLDFVESQELQKNSPRS